MSETTLTDVAISFINAFTPAAQRISEAFEQITRAWFPMMKTISHAQRLEIRRIHTMYRQRSKSRKRRRK